MGWLAFNAVFHHAPVADVATTLPPSTTPVDVDVSTAINRGRTYGDPAAPRTLEVVIDLTCRHCAEQYRPLMEALKPALAAKRVRVVVRHLVRPSQHASTPAAELALAAAAISEHGAALEILLGSNPDAGEAGLRARLADVLDPTKLDGVIDRSMDTIRTALADDQQRIALLGTGPQTPSAVLLEDGKVTKRWAGNLPAAAIAAALDGAL
jgi:protein-disulfide isomerase